MIYKQIFQRLKRLNGKIHSVGDPGNMRFCAIHDYNTWWASPLNLFYSNMMSIIPYYQE